MADDGSDLEATTPTQSEFATFQVLANTEFVNLRKSTKPVSPIIELANNENWDQDFQQDLAEVNVEEEKPQTSYEDKSGNYFLPQMPSDKEESDEEDSEQELPEPTESRFNTSAFFTPQPRAFDQASATSKHSEKSSKSSKSVKSGARSVKSKASERSFRASSSSDKPRRYKETNQAEIDAEKEGLLAELHSLERQGTAKLLRPLTMKDSLEEIQFQFDRIQAELNATQMVDFAKSAIKMGSGMLEMVLKRAGIKVVEGYHDNLCKDMSKFNRPLSRMYKKYWRRGGMSTEAELGMLVFGSLAWTVVQNKMGSATAAFTGSSDIPAVPEPMKQPTPTSGPRMRPPQMSSLNVPSSWTNHTSSEEDQVPDFSRPNAEEKLKEAEKKLAQAAESAASMMKQAELKMEQAEKLRKSLEVREREILVKEESLDEQSLVDEEEAPPPKVVNLNSNLSKNGSSRKRSTIINL